MAIKIRDLVKKLKEKDQSAEVEFVVVNTNGNLVCMDLKGSAGTMAELLKLFGTK